MIELLITSSLLILAVLAARALLAGRISRRMQYALWGLVLLRLLLPVSLPQSRASVLNALPDTAQVSLARPEEFQSQTLPVPVDTEVQTGTAPETDLAQTATGGTQAGLSGGVADTSGSEPHPEWSLNPAALLPLVWAAGAVLTGGALLWANLRFALRLRRERCQLDLAPEQTGGLPVYLCHDLASPCLHGLLHPAIYLNPAALESRERLEFVLAHEKTHHRHKDHIWGALRCVLLAVYWFDPLVWWAAAASKRDCELACDEAVTAAMEEARRRDYGRCLVELIPRRVPGTALLAATSMSGSAGAMQRRLKAIVTAKKPRRAAIALTLAGAVLLTACTFTGAMGKTIASADDLIGEGETVRQRLIWQTGDANQELILAQADSAPDGQVLTETEGWFRLYYWDSTRDNTAENTLYYEGRLLRRDPLSATAVTETGSSRYENGVLDEATRQVELNLLFPDGRMQRYTWTESGLEAGELVDLYADTAQTGEYDVQRQAVERLVYNVRLDENGLTFLVPSAEGLSGADWRIYLWENGGAAPVETGLPEVFTTQSWQAGESYTIPLELLTGAPMDLEVQLAATAGADPAQGVTYRVQDLFALYTGLYESGGIGFSLGDRVGTQEATRTETERWQQLEQLWRSGRWQQEGFAFTIPEGLTSEQVELHVYGQKQTGAAAATSTVTDPTGTWARVYLLDGSGTTITGEGVSDALVNQSWQPGDTLTLSANATAFYTRLVLHVREKATGQESYLRLPDPPADRQPAKTDGEPVDSRKYSYEEMVVEPQASVEFTKRLDELADGIQYEGGDAPLTVTIPETAEPGEWELHLVRYNESRGSWSSLSAGLPDAFVSQGWQPGQQETVNRTVMSQQGSYRLEVRNTLLNASAQILLPPASASATDAEADQQALVAATEKLVESLLASETRLEQEIQTGISQVEQAATEQERQAREQALEQLRQQLSSIQQERQNREQVLEQLRQQLSDMQQNGSTGQPAPTTPMPAQADAADAAERQYENWVASQSTYRPTPTPMPIDSLGGEGYPEGRVRSRGTLELDGRTQEMVALQIQPPEGVTLAGDELYLNLYYRDSQAPNPEFSLAFTGPVSVYQTFTIDYRDAESRTLTGTSPEGAASMELKIRLHSEPNQSSASD